TAGARNVISGNANFAISISDFNGPGATGNLVQGNFIGTDVGGTASIPNKAAIFITNVSGNTVGGTVAGAGNLIANNQNGLTVTNGNRNAILGNSILNNGDAEINLASGANNNQVPPVLTSVSSSGGFIALRGSATGPPNTTGLVQFFASDSCDPSGSG